MDTARVRVIVFIGIGREEMTSKTTNDKGTLIYSSNGIPLIFQTFNNLGGGKRCKHCNKLFGYKGHEKHEMNCNG